jgi:hypothetical protein
MSANAKVFTEGTYYQQRQMWDSSITSFPRIKLSTSATPPDPADVYPAPYTEPSNSGYSPIFMVTVSDTFTTAPIYTDVAFGPIVFNFDPYSGPLETVRHWWIEDSGESTLLWYGSLPIPFTIPLAGGTLTINTLTLRQEQCPSPPPPPPPSGPVVINWSTFTAPNGTALNAYPPDVGGTWSYNGAWTTYGTPSFTIAGGRLTCTSPSGNNTAAYIDSGESDCTVSADVASTQSGFWPGLYLRVSPLDGSGYLALMEGSLNTVSLWEFDGTSFNNVATGAVTSTGRITLRAALNSDTITVFADGVQVFQYGAAHRNDTVTTHGFAAPDSADNPSAYFDNFQVLK